MKAEEARAEYIVDATSQRNWPVMAIEEIADVNPRVDKAAIPDDLPVSFVPMPAVGAGDGSIRVDETRLANEVKKGFTAFLEGDVLFAKITPCMENGKMAVVPKLMNGYGFGSTEFHVLRPKLGMDAKYIYYYVSSPAFRGEAERYMTGAVGQRRVSTTYLKQSTIPVAPPDQQKRIVAEIEKQFSRLDEAVTNLKRVKANIKRYKAAVLKAAVEGRLVETEAELARREGRSYETGAQLLQRILETRRSQWQGKGKYKEPAAPDTTDLPELPEGWAVATLDAVAKTASGGTPRRDMESNFGGGIPWVKSGELGDGIVTATQETISTQGLESSSAKIFPKGTLCIALYGATVGKLGMLRIDAATNQAVCGIFPLVDIDAGYLWILLESMRRELISLGQGGAQPNISQEILRDLTVPIPPYAEQRRIVAEVDRVVSLIREMESQVVANLNRAESLRRSILVKAF